MAVVIPSVINWSVTPQNGQENYFTLMNTWLGESTSVIASLNTAIVKINESNIESNDNLAEVIEARDITVQARDEAVTAIATLTAGAIDDTTIAPNKAFSNSYIEDNYYDKDEAYNKTEVNDALDSIISLPIGAILNGFTIFDNCIVAFGGEFIRADYPKLWAYLQANPTLVKTQAQWATESTANGGICGFFSSGNGTTTFRVPNLDKAFLRPDSRTIASFQEDAIRNMKGSSGFSSGLGLTGPTGGNTGVFGVDAVNKGAALASTTGASYKLLFDASLVVPTANENRPKNIAVLPLIVAK